VLGQRRLGILHLRFGDGDIGRGGQLRRARRVDIGLSCGSFGDQRLGTLKIQLRLVQIGLGSISSCLLQENIGLRNGDAGLLLAYARFEARRFDSSENLPSFHGRAEIRIELADRA
jgi:hypothetical protein